MANMNIQIPDAQVNRVIAALCANLYKEGSATDLVDPTPALAKQVVLDYIKDRVKVHETSEALKNVQPPDVSNIVS